MIPVPLILGALGIAAYLAYNASSKPAAAPAPTPGSKPPGVSDAEWAAAGAKLEAELALARRNWMPVKATKPYGYAEIDALARRSMASPTVIVFGLQNKSVALTASGAGGDPVYMGAGGTVQAITIDPKTKERIWQVSYTHAVSPQVVMVGGTLPTYNTTPWQEPDVGATFFLKDADLSAPIV